MLQEVAARLPFRNPVVIQPVVARARHAGASSRPGPSRNEDYRGESNLFLSLSFPFRERDGGGQIGAAETRQL